MDAATIDRLYTRLSSGQRPPRGTKPFVTTPVNTTVEVYRDGTCGGEWHNFGPPSPVPFRKRRAQIVSWYGQPMRFKGGPVLRRLSEWTQGNAVFTVGRGRRQFDALITQCTPAEGASLKHILFKGVLWPFAHKPSREPRGR